MDFVIGLPDFLLPVEVKAPRQVTHDDARHLLAFLDDHPTAPAQMTSVPVAAAARTSTGLGRTRDRSRR